MNIYSIEIKDLLIAIKSHVAVILITTIGLAIIGFGVGFLYASTTQFVSPVGTDQVQRFNPTSIIDSEHYYFDYIEQFDTATEQVAIVLETLQKSDDYLVYTDTIDTLQIDLQELTVGAYKTVKQQVEADFIVPVTYVDEVRVQYEDKLLALAVQKKSAEASLALLDSIHVDSLQNSTIDGTYEAILNAANILPTLIVSESEYNKRLETVQDLEQLTLRVKEIDEVLIQSQESFDVIANKLDALLLKIATENQIVIEIGIGANPDMPTEYALYDKDTYVNESDQEQVVAFTVFFTLFGLAVGYVIAVYLTAKKKVGG